MKRFGIAVSVAAVVLSLSASAALAGEVTGTGRSLQTDSSHWGGELNGRSECAFSGQEDLQYFSDDADSIPIIPPTKGDPGHSQSWGQIQFPGLTAKETRDLLTSFGANPGIACNPTKSGGGGE